MHFLKKKIQKKEKQNVVSYLFVDHWIHKITKNNKIGIIQAKYLIKVKIGFSKEIFAYMVLITILAFSKFLSFSKFQRFSKFPNERIVQIVTIN